jgi:hypothetical protein
MLRYSFILGLNLLLIISCNYNVALVKNQKSAGVDSVLFYQQSSLSDPFVNSLLTNPGNSASLRATIFPPLLPKDSVSHISGYRIQVFASSDSLSALTSKAQLISRFSENVYMIHQDGLFKLHLGDFLNRESADAKKAIISQSGYPGAWIVSCFIKAPVENNFLLRPDVNADNEDNSLVIRFKIQVIATGDLNKANQVVSELSRSFTVPVYYESTGNLYKVYVGKFAARPEAESVLQKVRLSGYPDAWLVY